MFVIQINEKTDWKIFNHWCTYIVFSIQILNFKVVSLVTFIFNIVLPINMETATICVCIVLSCSIWVVF